MSFSVIIGLVVAAIVLAGGVYVFVKKSVKPAAPVATTAPGPSTGGVIKS